MLLFVLLSPSLFPASSTFSYICRAKMCVLGFVSSLKATDLHWLSRVNYFFSTVYSIIPYNCLSFPVFLLLDACSSSLNECVCVQPYDLLWHLNDLFIIPILSPFVAFAGF